MKIEHGRQFQYGSGPVTPAPTPDPITPEVYTATVAKTLVTLKARAGIASIRQNYKGTGSQRARRQLWITFTNGRAIDVWLDADSYTLGGVTVLRVPGRWHYTDGSPAQIADRIADQLRTLGGVK